MRLFNKPNILNWRGYLFAIGLVALATWLKYLAQPDIIPADTPILYIAAIVVTATFFGLDPSILACVLSVIAYDFFFVQPVYIFTAPGIQDYPIIAIFFLVGVLISYLSSNLRQKREVAVREIATRKKAEAELTNYRDHLEDLIKQRTAELEKANIDLKHYTAELESANKELESFSYTVSHDLRSPLRSMDGYSQALLEDYAGSLDEQGKQWLDNIRISSQHMGRLIDDILGLSRVIRAELKFEKVDLTGLATSLAAKLKETEPERQVEFIIMPGVEVMGDNNLLGLVLQNLLGNAFKFTARCPMARIEFGFTRREGRKVYFVRDNGAGFDVKYVDKLFKPFQRLHNDKEYPGTGIGLATVQRIIHRHGGEVWAEGEVGKGATFYFTLSQERN